MVVVVYPWASAAPAARVAQALEGGRSYLVGRGVRDPWGRSSYGCHPGVMSWWPVAPTWFRCVP